MHGRQMSSSAQILSPFFFFPSLSNAIFPKPSQLISIGVWKPQTLIFRTKTTVERRHFLPQKFGLSTHATLHMLYGDMISRRPVQVHFFEVISLCPGSSLDRTLCTHAPWWNEITLESIKKQAWNHVQLEGRIDTGIGTIATRGCNNKVRRSCTFT